MLFKCKCIVAKSSTVNRITSEHEVKRSLLGCTYSNELRLFEELPKITVLQNCTVTKTSVRMEQHVRKMPHIIHTSASVHLASPENTVKPVSSVVAYLEQMSVMTYAILPFSYL